MIDKLKNVSKEPGPVQGRVRIGHARFLARDNRH
jgi:hypothetical protein